MRMDTTFQFDRGRSTTGLKLIFRISIAAIIYLLLHLIMYTMCTMIIIVNASGWFHPAGDCVFLGMIMSYETRDTLIYTHIFNAALIIHMVLQRRGFHKD